MKLFRSGLFCLKVQLVAGLRQLLALILSTTMAFGQSGGKTVVVASGATNTSVTTKGSVTNVTTATISGNNAYNSFTSFTEQQGSTINLFLPSGTNNLLNLVNQGSVLIDGTVNSILNDKVGGNVYFADPFGVIVGKNGVVNAGAFFAVTPTADFQSKFFDNGNPSADGTAAFLNGTVPITPDGLISVKGRINAIQNIGLFGGSVLNAGKITSGAIFSATKPDFSDVVNVAGLQSGTQLVVQNGQIQIQASGDFENAGTITTLGAANLNGGNISVQAGGNIQLDAGSLISAAGSGANSNGGTIQIRGAQNANIDAGAIVTAAAGSTGDGGSVDFSATNTVNWNGGQLLAGAANGKAGTVTIDPTTLNITSNDVPNDGSNIDLEADSSITVASNVTISSRQISASDLSHQNFLNGQSTGNSGSIKISAPSITVGNNAQVLSNATGAFTAGDINIIANATDSESNAIPGGSGQASATAAITIGAATISGNNVNVQANATSSSTDIITPGGSGTSNYASIALSGTFLGFLLTGPAGQNSSSATANVSVAPSATINGAGNVTLDSEAISSTTMTVSGILAGVAYGTSDANATTTLAKNATVNSKGSFTLEANTNNTLAVTNQTADEKGPAVAVAIGKGTSNSLAEMDGTVFAGPNATVQSSNTDSFSTTASASEGSNPGTGAGIGVALSWYTSSAQTNVPGQLNAAGAVSATSASTRSTDLTSASSQIQDGTNEQNVENNLVPFLGDIKNFISSCKSGPCQFLSPPSSASSGLGLSAGVSLAQDSNSSTTTITGGINAEAGSATVSSTAIETPQINALGSASGSTVSIGGSVAYGSFSNTANTQVNANSTVAATTGVSITADAEMPNPFAKALQTVVALTPPSAPSTPADLEGIPLTLIADGSTIQSDLQNIGNFLTSYTNTALSAKGTSPSKSSSGLAGSVDLQTISNTATAAVSGNANILNLSGDVVIDAIANVNLLNASGMGLIPPSVVSTTPGGVTGNKTDSSLGGSAQVIDVANSSSASIGDSTIVRADAGNINVASDTTTWSFDLVQSGDQAQKFGVTGVFHQLNLTQSSQAYIQSDATVNASQNVNVTASSVDTNFNIGGALGLQGFGQVGVTVDWNNVSNNTQAYIGDPANARTSVCAGCGVTAGGNVAVAANSQENIYTGSFAATASGITSGSGVDGEYSSGVVGSLAPSANNNFADTSDANASAEGQPPLSPMNNAGGGSFGFGVSANVAINQVGSSSSPGIVTKAFVNNAANVTATGGISVTAQDQAVSIDIGAAGAVAKNAALAGAYTQNQLNKQVQAFTIDTTISGNNLTVNANGSTDLISVSAGAAVDTLANGFSIAGAVNNDAIANSVFAGISGGTSAPNIGSGGVTVSASENGDHVVSGAGGFQAGGSGGIGAAIDIGNYQDSVSAYVGASNLATTGNIAVTANTGVLYLPIAASLSGGTSFGAAGSLDFETITENTTSSVSGNVSTSQNLLIGSSDSSSAIMVAGGLGISGNVGFGVAAILPDFTRYTNAFIGPSAVVSAAGSDAASLAYDNHSIVGILVDANTSGGLSDYVAAGSISGSTALAGAAIVNQPGSKSLADSTSASISANASVNGQNTNAAADQAVLVSASDSSNIQDVAGMLAIGGDLGVGIGLDILRPNWNVTATIASGASVNAAGNVAVDSKLQDHINTFAVAGTLAGGVAAAGSVSDINENSNVTSQLNGQANAGGSVEVGADRSSSINPVAGNLAAGLGLGVGIGVSTAVTNTNDTVLADVGTGGTVNALGNHMLVGINGQTDSSGLTVAALSSLSIDPIAAGVAGSGYAGAQGSVPVDNLTSSTTAQINSSANINGSNTGAAANQVVNVLASDNTTVDTIAGAAAVGAAALAAAVDYENLNRNVTAETNGATVNAASSVTVNASTQGSITSWAISGSAGGYSGAGANSVLNDNTSTLATISGGTVNAGAAVNVDASRSSNISVKDGSGALGFFAGLNESLVDINQNNSTQASVATGATINASALSVNAAGSESNSTIAVGGSLGLNAAVSGSVTSTTYTEQTQAVIGASTINIKASTAAINGISVVAQDTTTSNANDGAVAASFGVGIGLALDQETYNKNTGALIGNSASITDGNGVTVSSTSTESLTSLTGSGGVGVLGASGTDANYSVNPATAASIGASTINASGVVNVNASDNLGLNTTAGVVAVGVGAVGGANVNATSGAHTSASISGATINETLTGNSLLSGGNDIDVTSTYTDSMNAQAYAGTGSVIGADAAAANLTDNGANNASLDGTIVRAGNLKVFATSNRADSANAGGLNVSGLAAGATMANTNVGGATTAEASGTIGSGGPSYVTGLDLEAVDAAPVSGPTASAQATQTSGGIGAASFNSANANVSTLVSAGIGAGSNMNVVSFYDQTPTGNQSGNLIVHATSAETANSQVSAGSYGGLTIGGAVTESSVTPTVTASIGDGVNISTDVLKVQADASGSATSQSDLSSGSLIGVGNNSSSSANNSPVVNALIGDASNASLKIASLFVNIVAKDAPTATADANGSSISGVNIPGDTLSSANANDVVNATIGPNATITISGSFPMFSMTASSTPSATATTEQSSAGVVVNGGDSGAAVSQACIYAPASCGSAANQGGISLNLDPGSDVSEPIGAVTFKATGTANASSTATGSVTAIFSGANNVSAASTENLNPAVSINGATIYAPTGYNTIASQVVGGTISSQATTTTNGAKTDTSLSADTEATANPSISITGSNITSTSLLIEANVGRDDYSPLLSNPVTETNAKGEVNGFTGSISATGTNNTSYDPTVSVDSNTQITTQLLTVSAQSFKPTPDGNNSLVEYQKYAQADNKTVVAEVIGYTEQLVNEAFGWIPGLGDLVEEIVPIIANVLVDVTDSGSTQAVKGNYSFNSAVHMNGKINEIGGGYTTASLTVNPGTSGPTFSGSGITASDDGKGDVVVAPIVNVAGLPNSATAITLNASTGTVDGDLTIIRLSSLQTVNITNNTNENLVIGSISSSLSNGQSPDLTVKASASSNFNPSFTGQATTAINVVDNGAAGFVQFSNVIFNGYIADGGGSLTVKDPAGSILFAGNGSGGSLLPTDLLEANQFSFTASGAVGGISTFNGNPTSPLPLRFVSGLVSTTPKLNVSAGVDVNINADLVGYVMPGDTPNLTPPSITSIVTGGAVNLNLSAPEALMVQTVGPPTPVPINSSGYQLGNITASTNVNVSLGSSPSGTIGTLSATSNGDITSKNGNVSLVAGGDIDYVNINAPNGTATLQASGNIVELPVTGAGIVAQGVQLSSFGTVGTAQSPIHLETASANVSGTNGVDILDNSASLAISASDTYNNLVVDNTGGDVVAGSLFASLGGNLEVTAKGNILVNSPGTAIQTGRYSGGDIDLTAGGYVGTTSSPIGLSGHGNVNIQAGGAVNIYDPTGSALNVGTVTAQSGNINLTANLANINLGVVNAVNGNVTLTSGANIANTATTGNSVSVSGNYIDLVATSGVIGSAKAPISVNNRNPKVGVTGQNYLDAYALNGIYLAETNGNLLSNLMQSLNGNISITASSNASLNQVLGTDWINIVVYGNQLNVLNIGAPNGAVASGHAPSPTSVTLEALQPGGTLSVNQLAASSSITTQADFTNLGNVIATNLAGSSSNLDTLQSDALTLSMKGSQGVAATSLQVNITPCSGCSTANPVIFSNFLTQNGTVSSGMDWLEFWNAEIAKTAQVNTPYQMLTASNLKPKTPLASWNLFLVGNQYQTNGTSIENFSSVSVKPYNFPLPPQQIFDYLMAHSGSTLLQRPSRGTRPPTGTPSTTVNEPNSSTPPVLQNPILADNQDQTSGEENFSSVSVKPYNFPLPPQQIFDYLLGHWGSIVLLRPIRGHTQATTTVAPSSSFAARPKSLRPLTGCDGMASTTAPSDSKPESQSRPNQPASYCSSEGSIY